MIRANRKIEWFRRIDLARCKNWGFNCECFAQINSRESLCESPLPLSWELPRHDFPGWDPSGSWYRARIPGFFPKSDGRRKKSRKEPQGKNAKGKNFWKLRGRIKCSQEILQKIYRKIEDITLVDFIVFLDIFEIFAEDCFLLRSFRKFLPSGFLPSSRFQKSSLGMAGESRKMSLDPGQPQTYSPPQPVECYTISASAPRPL